MLNKVLSTPIDNLVEIVKRTGTCKLSYLNNELNVSPSILDKWLVILEEYDVLTVKYSGLDGYVRYIEKIEIEEVKSKSEIIDANHLKIDFTKKARMKNLSTDKIKKIWPQFIKKYEEEIKENFLSIAQKRGHEPEKVNKAWKKYKEELYNF